MNRTETIENLIKEYQYGIDSLPFVLDAVRTNFSHLEIKSVNPYFFTIGSNFNNEGLKYDIELVNSLMYGRLYISINPNGNPIADEVIKLKYRSYFDKIPFWKHITRKVEIENLINESTVSTELFDKIELEQLSDSYDVYVTFAGFKIDII